MNPDDEGLSFVYPFVLTKSNGGPLDDDAFVAGFRCGVIAGRMQEEAYDFEEMLPPDLVEQLKLMAGHYGYGFRVEGTTDEYWRLYRFQLGGLPETLPTNNAPGGEK